MHVHMRWLRDIYWLRDDKYQCWMVVQLSHNQGVVCESYQLLLNIAHRSHMRGVYPKRKLVASAILQSTHEIVLYWIIIIIEASKCIILKVKLQSFYLKRNLLILSPAYMVLMIFGYPQLWMMYSGYKWLYRSTGMVSRNVRQSF